MAVTYYVSAVGSDANLGTSPALPWLTVGHVNGFPLQPGDAVLFRAGDLFTDAALSPPRGGAPGNPITFGSYNAGQATIRFATPLFFQGGASYWTVHDLVFDAAGSTGDVATSENPGLPNTHITLLRCTLENAPNGSGAYSQKGFTTASDDAYWLLDSCIIQNVGVHGARMVGSRSEVRGCTIHDTGSDDSTLVTKHGILVESPYSLTHANTLYDIALTTLFDGDAVHLTAHHHDVYGNRFTGNASGSGGFLSYASALTSAPPAYGSWIYQNKIDQLTTYLFSFAAGGSGWDDFIVANNTSVEMANGCSGFLITNAKSRSRIELANNALSMTAGASVAEWAQWGTVANRGNLVEHFNAFRQDGGSAGNFWFWNAGLVSRHSWELLTGQGASDLLVATAEDIDPVTFIPNLDSPWINLGTTSVTGITYIQA